MNYLPNVKQGKIILSNKSLNKKESNFLLKKTKKNFKNKQINNKKNKKLGKKMWHEYYQSIEFISKL